MHAEQLLSQTILHPSTKSSTQEWHNEHYDLVPTSNIRFKKQYKDIETLICNAALENQRLTVQDI